MSDNIVPALIGFGSALTLFILGWLADRALKRINARNSKLDGDKQLLANNNELMERLANLQDQMVETRDESYKSKIASQEAAQSARDAHRAAERVGSDFRIFKVEVLKGLERLVQSGTVVIAVLKRANGQTLAEGDEAEARSEVETMLRIAGELMQQAKQEVPALPPPAITTPRRPGTNPLDPARLPRAPTAPEGNRRKDKRTNTNSKGLENNATDPSTRHLPADQRRSPPTCRRRETMLNGQHVMNRNFTAEDYRLLQAARPQCALLLYPDHTKAEAYWLKQQGVQQLIVRVDGDRLDIHREDLAAAVQRFGADITIQVGNEPDGNQPDRLRPGIGNLWEHRYYLLDILQYRAMYPGVKLLSPPLACPAREYQANWRAWLDTSLNGDSLRRVYGAFDAISVHAYDYWEARYLLEAVDFMHQLFPTKQLYITEYGIDGMLPGDVSGNQPAKVARYAEFVRGCRQRPYVAATMMFIAGNNLPGGFGNYEVGAAIAGLAGV